MIRRTLVRVAWALGFIVLALLLTHWAVGYVARIAPPEIEPRGADAVRPRPGVRTLGASWVLERPGLFEVHLTGDPLEIGHAHARLLYPEMVENEGILLGHFERSVPSSVLRALLLDVAQLRYRDLGGSFSTERRLELAAMAQAFRPDPYTGIFPTFQRFVYLNALYDIALSFEHSPLIGCTSFVFSGSALAGDGALLARNFDFEVDPIFDRKKAVFFVRESGRIPFASVAWPGLVGVVSGMNIEGLAVVVHGGRAGQPRTQGEPVVHALRAVLSTASNVDRALLELAKRPPLVSHILVLADRSGHSVRVERVPGSADHVTRLGERAAVTNHFEGPAAADPKNAAVRANTSTLARRARADELLRGLGAANVRTAVELLRDRRGAGGGELQLGDRDAIDALIATHGVVMETGSRTLWVSLAPHLLGGFVAFKLEQALSAAVDTSAAPELRSLPADPLLGSGKVRRLQR